MTKSLSRVCSYDMRGNGNISRFTCCQDGSNWLWKAVVHFLETSQTQFISEKRQVRLYSGENPCAPLRTRHHNIHTHSNHDLTATSRPSPHQSSTWRPPLPKTASSNLTPLRGYVKKMVGHTTKNQEKSQSPTVKKKNKNQKKVKFLTRETGNRDAKK